MVYTLVLCVYAGRNRAEPGGTGRSRAEPGGTGRNRVEPGGTGRNRAEPGGTGQGAHVGFNEIRVAIIYE